MSAAIISTTTAPSKITPRPNGGLFAWDGLKAAVLTATTRMPPTAAQPCDAVPVTLYGIGG